MLVVNKYDVDPDGVKRVVGDHPNAVAISARTGYGIENMLRTLGDRLRALSPLTELVIPFSRGDVLAAVHREGEVLSEEATEENMVVRARLDNVSLSRFREFLVADSGS